MTAKPNSKHRAGVAMTLLAALAVVAAMVASPWTTAAATHAPADKISVTGSALEVMSTPVTGGMASEEVTLGSATMKTSSPTDLLFSVTAECALWTNVTTTGSETQSAFAQVEMWVEIDGVPVTVAGNDTTANTGTQPGHVVFCDRTYSRTTSFADDEEHVIETYVQTRTANAFNWATLNVGSGSHTLELKAQVTRQATSTGTANAAVGKRTMIVEPVKLTNDVTL